MKLFSILVLTAAVCAPSWATACEIEPAEELIARYTRYVEYMVEENAHSGDVRGLCTNARNQFITDRDVLSCNSGTFLEKRRLRSAINVFMFRCEQLRRGQR